MPAPLRGTQSLVGQMGWVFARPSLTLLEVAWRWVFGIPFLAVCWLQAQKILVDVPLESSGLNGIDPQNPWVAALQLARAWGLYQPHLAAILRWLVPVAALAWVILSGLGRSLVLQRIDPSLRIGFRPLRMMLLQAGWLDWASSRAEPSARLAASAVTAVSLSATATPPRLGSAEISKHSFGCRQPA